MCLKCLCLGLFFFKVFNGFLLNGLESFISEKERLEGKAPGFDAEGERGGGQGAKWDMKQCLCARTKLESAPVISDIGKGTCYNHKRKLGSSLMVMIL